MEEIEGTEVGGVDMGRGRSRARFEVGNHLRVLDDSLLANRSIFSNGFYLHKLLNPNQSMPVSKAHTLERVKVQDRVARLARLSGHISAGFITFNVTIDA